MHAQKLGETIKAEDVTVVDVLPPDTSVHSSWVRLIPTPPETCLTKNMCAFGGPKMCSILGQMAKKGNKAQLGALLNDLVAQSSNLAGRVSLGNGMTVEAFGRKRAMMCI
jgi:hypothetical protein